MLLKLNCNGKMKNLKKHAGSFIHVLFLDGITRAVAVIKRLLNIFNSTCLYTVPRLRELKSLCTEIGLPCHNAFVLPSKSRNSNAALVDIFGIRRYLLVTEGFCSNLNSPSVKMILCHEKGHLKYRHSTYLILITIAGLLFSLFLLSSFESVIWEAIAGNQSFQGFCNGLVFAGILFTLVVLWNFVIKFFSFLFEVEADIYSACFFADQGNRPSDQVKGITGYLAWMQNRYSPKARQGWMVFTGSQLSHFLYKKRIRVLNSLMRSPLLLKRAPFFFIFIRIFIICFFAFSVVYTVMEKFKFYGN